MRTYFKTGIEMQRLRIDKTKIDSTQETAIA